jgi:propanol-preferring alcohol dehydrogenase
MKAQVLAAPVPVARGPLSLEVFPEPDVPPDEVSVEVSVCGVCRTDLHIVEGELVPPRYPVVPGHQAVGRVVEAGADVRGVAVGDRVGVAWVGSFDGVCDYCVEGRENLCESPTFTGFDRAGGFAERIAARAAFVHRIPDELGDDAQVAPLLCAGIIGYRALKQSGFRPGSSLALYGFGAAAHIAIQIAVGCGAEVFVVSPGKDSLERAMAMGAAWTGVPGERLPRPVDHAVTFAPVGSILPQALADLRRGGTLSIAGIHLDRVPELDYDTHLFQERTLVSTTANTRADARELLRIAGRMGIKTDVQLFPLEQANDALLRLKEGTLDAQAAVLRIRD